MSLKIAFDRRIRSKTYLFNIATAILSGLEANLHILQPLVPGNVYLWLLVVSLVGNAVCRELTHQPLADK